MGFLIIQIVSDIRNTYLLIGTRKTQKRRIRKEIIGQIEKISYKILKIP